MKFEIKHPEYVNRTYRIPKELADKLSQIAQQENISVNELVVQSCQFALENLKKRDYVTLWSAFYFSETVS